MNSNFFEKKSGTVIIKEILIDGAQLVVVLTYIQIDIKTDINLLNIEKIIF